MKKIGHPCLSIEILISEILSQGKEPAGNYQNCPVFATTIPKYREQHLKICELWHYFAAMKLFASIMALVVLALSVMPCADMAATGSKVNISYSQNHSGQDQDAPDDCSPFCTCSCCSTSFNLSINSAPAATIPTFDGKVTMAYNSSKPIEISLPIWQPPQLS